MEATDMAQETILLRKDTFDRLFPFHFSFNAQGEIHNIGPSFNKILRYDASRLQMADIFQFVRPLSHFDYTNVIINSHQLFILRHIPTECVFRGTVQSLDYGQTATFLGSPWITDPEQLSVMGLTLNDFASYDQTLDMLHLLQTQRIATVDLKKLNATLIYKSTQLREKEAELIRQKDEIEAIYLNAPIGLGYFNDHLNFVRLNQKLADINGQSIERHIGKSIHDMLPDIAQTAEDSIKRIIETKLPAFIEDVPIPKRFNFNETNHYYVEWYPIMDENGSTNGYGLVVQNITQTKIHERALLEKEERIVKMYQELEDKVAQRTSELAATNQALTQLIRIDFLTGLPNRLAGQEQIRLEYLRMKRTNSFYCLMVIDIDHFKLINDLHGHEVGDKKLHSVGSILQNSIRESDFVARWGGEEFIILLRDIRLTDAVFIAEKLRLAVEKSVDELDINVTISIGVSCSATTDENADLILTRADKLLYLAKNNGRNQVCSDVF